MSQTTYQEKLRDPRWQKRRLEIFQRENFTCEGCGDKEETLHVHHKFYKRGTDPWEYEDHALSCLCESCHEVAPIYGRIIMGSLSPKNQDRLAMTFLLCQDSGLKMDALIQTFHLQAEQMLRELEELKTEKKRILEVLGLKA